MSNDTVWYLLSFIFLHVVNISCFVQLRLTALFSLGAIQNLVDVWSLATTRIFVIRAKGSYQIHLDFWRSCVVATVSHFSDRIELLTSVAFQQMKIWPNLPVDFFPWNTIGFSNEGYELLKVPVSVHHVLGSHLSIGVYKRSALTAWKDLALLLGEQLGAVGALVKIVLIFFKEQFKLLHK